MMTYRDNNSLQQLYNEELNIDIESRPDFQKIKEFMVARHLYKHNFRLLDEKFVNDLKLLTNDNLMNDSEIINSHNPADTKLTNKKLSH